MDKEMMDKNEVNKALLHCNWANRRMFFTVLAVCITFIIVVAINTIRETRWQATVRELQLQMTNAITEMAHGQNTD